jgi:hypothetical protein
VFNVGVEDPFEQSGPTHPRRRALHFRLSEEESGNRISPSLQSRTCWKAIFLRRVRVGFARFSVAQFLRFSESLPLISSFLDGRLCKERCADPP